MPMPLYNDTGIIGVVLDTATTNVTGTFILTLGAILMIFIVVTLVFRIPLEYMFVLLFPLFLVVSAFYMPLKVVLGIAIFALAVIGLKKWVWGD